MVYPESMGKRVTIQTELTTEELHERYRQAHETVERTHWHILWQAKEGKTPQEIASVLGYTARWVRTVIGKWNAEGEEGIRDHRQDAAGHPPLLSPSLQAELEAALQGPPEDGGLWSGPKVAQWMQKRLDRPVAAQRGWEYLQRLGYSTHVPRPEHAKATQEEQHAFKKTARRGSDRSARVSPGQRRTLGDG
jgi:transposase